MLEEIKEIAKEYTELEVKLDTKLRSELGLTSFDLISMIGDVEDKFGVTISDEDIANIYTTEDLIKYIEAHK